MEENNKQWVWASKPTGRPGRVKLYKKYIRGSKKIIPLPSQIPPPISTVTISNDSKPIQILPKTREKNLDTAGIYVIICEIEKHVYVGQSINVDVRLRNHKMAIQSATNTLGRNYVKIQEHYKKHGIEAFQFVNYISCPFANTKELLYKESETISAYSKMGYNLYNTSVNITIGVNTINCPVEYQPIINELIRKLSSSSLDALRVFIDTHLNNAIPAAKHYPFPESASTFQESNIDL